MAAGYMARSISSLRLRQPTGRRRSRTLPATDPAGAADQATGSAATLLDRRTRFDGMSGRVTHSTRTARGWSIFSRDRVGGTDRRARGNTSADRRVDREIARATAHWLARGLFARITAHYLAALAATSLPGDDRIHAGPPDRDRHRRLGAAWDLSVETVCCAVHSAFWNVAELPAGWCRCGNLRRRRAHLAPSNSRESIRRPSTSNRNSPQADQSSVQLAG